MFLTRILIDKKRIKALKLWDNYGWHRALWHAFPQLDGESRNFLFRVDDRRFRFKVLLLSEHEPQKQPWEAQSWETKEIPPEFLSRDTYFFQMKANPTMKKTYSNGKKRRIGLYQEKLLRDWIFRKAEDNGFDIVQSTLTIGGPIDASFWIPEEKRKGKHVSVDFKGMLKVTDQTRFQHAFEQGIGSAKAYGFGLLMLQPA